jgi:hypothetical protein
MNHLQALHSSPKHHSMPPGSIVQIMPLWMELFFRIDNFFSTDTHPNLQYRTTYREGKNLAKLELNPAKFGTNAANVQHLHMLHLSKMQSAQTTTRCL